jgi:DNA-binding XRE family transcriptional regulator
MVRRKKRQLSGNQSEEIVPLRAIRDELGMTQAEFAVAIGLDPSTVSRCERGLSEPNFTILQLKRLCKLTGKTLEELPDRLGRTSADGE